MVLARAETDTPAGVIKTAHGVLFDAHVALAAAGAHVPADLRKLLALLHAYILLRLGGPASALGVLRRLCGGQFSGAVASATAELAVEAAAAAERADRSRHESVDVVPPGRSQVAPRSAERGAAGTSHHAEERRDVLHVGRHLRGPVGVGKRGERIGGPLHHLVGPGRHALILPRFGTRRGRDRGAAGATPLQEPVRRAGQPPAPTSFA
jgi:hypothetical protein